MDRWRRAQRLAVLVQRLVERPSTLLSLGDQALDLGVAKSSLSEDVALARDAVAALGRGRIETVTGPGGGVRYVPLLTREEMARGLTELATLLSRPDRILPGGFVYMADVIFSPAQARFIGEVFATAFASTAPEFVATVETKGIPIGLFTAHALGLPLVLLRRDSRVTEGPSVSITYVSGSTQRIQTMSAPRRALPVGARVLVVDDFMKAGGTARGMMDLLAECSARVAGVGVFVATAEPVRKRIDEYLPLLVLEAVDEVGRQTRFRLASWLAGDGSRPGPG